MTKKEREMPDSLNDEEKEHSKKRVTRGKRKNVITLGVMKKSNCKNVRKKERKLCMKSSMMKKRTFKERG